MSRTFRRTKKEVGSSKKSKKNLFSRKITGQDRKLRQVVRKQKAKEFRKARKEGRFEMQIQMQDAEDFKLEKLKREISSAKFDFKTPVVTKQRRLGTMDYTSNYNEFKSVIESADVILEVVDSRDPLGSRCPQIEQSIIDSGKKLILILNKIDLIPKQNMETWLKLLRQELPSIPFKSCTVTKNENFFQPTPSAILSDSLQESLLCVGASILFKVLENYCNNKNIQSYLKVGVIGFPNVGKSSVINSLNRIRYISESPNPEVFSATQKIAVDKRIQIINIPGILYAKDNDAATLALRNVIKVETLKNIMEPVESIIKRANHTQLCSHYGTSHFSSSDEFLGLLAKRLVKYKKGGIPDTEAVARKLIDDWNSGKIKYYTCPPENYKPYVQINAEYISEMIKAFNIDVMEEKLELDKVPEVKSGEAIAAKGTKPTECFVPIEPVEEMETDVTDGEKNQIKPKQKKLTATPQLSESARKKLISKYARKIKKCL